MNCPVCGRMDLPWQDEIQAEKAIHKLYQSAEGTAIKGHGGGWGLKQTARLIGKSVGTVSQDIRLAEVIELKPELAEERHKTHAFEKARPLFPQVCSGGAIEL